MTTFPDVQTNSTVLKQQLEEKSAFHLPGIPMIGLILLMLAGGTLAIVSGSMVAIVVGGLVDALALLFWAGLIPVAPGQARVIKLFGRYDGTIHQTGLQWVNPFTTRTKVSVRIRNQETPILKVNEAQGNPIEIAAVVVWQVWDTAKATFVVDDFVQFVAKQAETAVRHVATNYPYDAHGDGRLSLRDNPVDVTTQLTAEITERVAAAGVRVIESRLTHLAYAPEIAQAMLRRQQADAVVAARQRIVEGAVGMVQQALEQLAANDIVDLDEERKAAMVSNLLVVLCSELNTQPVVNTGGLYH